MTGWHLNLCLLLACGACTHVPDLEPERPSCGGVIDSPAERLGCPEGTKELAGECVINPSAECPPELPRNEAGLCDEAAAQAQLAPPGWGTDLRPQIRELVEQAVAAEQSGQLD